MKKLNQFAVLILLATSTWALAQQVVQPIDGEYFKNTELKYDGKNMQDESAAGRKAQQFCVEKGYKGMMAFYFQSFVVQDVFCSNHPRTSPQVDWARTIIMRDRLARKALLRPDANAVMEENKNLKFTGYSVNENVNAKKNNASDGPGGGPDAGSGQQ